MAADITLIPASVEGGLIEQLQKEVQGVPGTTDQPVLSFYGLDTELFDVDVYVEDAAGASSPAATTRGLGLGDTNAGASSPGTPAPGPTYTAGAGIDISPAGEISATTGLTPTQQAALNRVSAPVVALVGGVATGYASLAAALAAAPTLIHLKAPALLDTPGPSPIFFGTAIFGNGYPLTVGNGAELRLFRYTAIHNCLLNAQGTGLLRVIGGGTPGGGTIPTPSECLQVVDSRIDAPVYLAAATSYQGLVLRGNSTANVASGGGPVYLYDLAEVSGSLPAGFTLYNRRPDAASQVYFSKWTISPGQYMSSTTTSAADGYQYYFIAPPQKVSEILPVGAAGYDAGTGIFTAPVHGLYDVNYYVAVVGLNAGDEYTALVSSPGSPKPPLAQQWFAVGPGTFNEGRLAETLELLAGQQIKLAIGATHAQAGQSFQFVCVASVKLTIPLS